MQKDSSTFRCIKKEQAEDDIPCNVGIFSPYTCVLGLIGKQPGYSLVTGYWTMCTLILLPLGPFLLSGITRLKKIKLIIVALSSFYFFFRCNVIHLQSIKS